MAAYIADSDMNALYGTTNCAYWADIDGSWVKGAAESAAMTARRLAARDYATALVEDVLRTSDLNFKLPLTTVPATLVNVCVKIAGWWMSKFRHGDRLATDYKDALEILQLIVTGKIKLDL